MKTLYSRSRLAAASFVLAAAVALATGCGKDKSAGKAPPAVPVMAADAVAMDVPVKVRAIGTVEAFNTVAVTARVGGQLLQVGFTEGQDVGKGDLLLQLDPAPFQAALAEAQANLERDKAREDNAGADVARYTDLVGKDYVTKQDYDAVVATAAAAKATVQADQAALESARLNLDYCTIRAPIAGRTGNLLVKQGNMVTANSPNPLVTINQIVPIYVSFTIPEQRLAEVRRYSGEGSLAVDAFLSYDSTKVFEGKLTFIDNSVDERTGTIELKATFPNGDRALWPGQFINVDLVLTKELNATVVPATAVQTSQQGDYVFVVRADDTVESRQVTQGVKLDDKVVIEKGVQAGERVVTDGQLRLTSGAKVTMKTALTPSGPPSGSQGAHRK